MEKKENNLPMDTIIVLIPSLNPDDKLKKYVSELIQIGFRHILIVNDGSRADCLPIFEAVDGNEEVTVLHHDSNKGKGRALKTGFQWCIKHFSTCQGIVTADSDGQHSAIDTKKVALALLENPVSLVLGTRDFNKEEVPFKSRYGNKITTVVFSLLYGTYLQDTQTGLRGIGTDLFKPLCELKGERFEYEIRMLIYIARHKIPCEEVFIETIYLDDNKESHFKPVRDSARIYGVIFASFFQYLLSSLSASIIDMGIFALLHLWVFRGMNLRDNIFFSTILARIVSSFYNFLINRNVVFGAKGHLVKNLLSYYLLVIVQMACSTGLVYFFTNSLSGPAVIVKAVVDSFLFLVSFQIQQRIVFRD